MKILNHHIMMSRGSSQKPRYLPVYKKVLMILFCFIVCIVTSSCEAEEKKDDKAKDFAEAFSVTGHILYKYKHGVDVYGQYMDQAGENNAMLLVFVDKEDNSTADVQCSSVMVNGVPVETDVKIKFITQYLSAIQINITSTKTEVDELNQSDNISLVLEIIDSETSISLDVTKPIEFPCK